jgi:hypothetical protein
VVNASGQQPGPTRYERILAGHVTGGDLGLRLSTASRDARSRVQAVTGRDRAIRDVAAGVAAPALVGCVIWMLREARARGVRRLRFLSRDGQVLCELARRLAPYLNAGLDLEYVYSSRRTWSLAATDPGQLLRAEWLFNSFIKSNAADVCARLGLPPEEYRRDLLAAGASLDPEARADDDRQAAALTRFLARPAVAAATATRVSATRRLVVEYAAQHQLTGATTALADAGWTGRMAGALVQVCEQAGMTRPHILFWGHEPRATGWTDPDRVTAWMYNTATGRGLRWRVPDAPFAVETFCMGDHGIVTGYTRAPDGQVEPVLAAPVNAPAQAWGLRLYRRVLYAFCDALTATGPILDADARPAVWRVMDAFWCHPTRAEARAWGSYPYDSDPAGTAIRPLARPLAIRYGQALRGDRAWIAGSLALTSNQSARTTFLHQSSQAELAGSPATD